MDPHNFFPFDTKWREIFQLNRTTPNGPEFAIQQISNGLVWKLMKLIALFGIGEEV